MELALFFFCKYCASAAAPILADQSFGIWGWVYNFVVAALSELKRSEHRELLWDCVFCNYTSMLNKDENLCNDFIN